MKKLFLLLLPVCLGANSTLAQDISIPDPGNGIDHTHYISPLPLLDEISNDAESKYTLTLIDDTNEPKPEWLKGKSINDMLYEKNGLKLEKKLIDNTPYLPKRRFEPRIPGRLKS